MVFTKDCDLIFDNNRTDSVFYAGETVSGVITLNLKKGKKFTDLVFRPKGEAKCEWTEREGTGDDAKDVTYTGSAEYLKSYTSLFDHSYQRQNGSVILPRGDYKFRFSFPLSNVLPSSFEGSDGKIRYSIKVTSKRSYSLDKSCVWPFTVINRNNLNDNPANKKPIKDTFSKDFHSLFSNRGTLSITANIQYSGYAPGQDILINCNIMNDSKVSIGGIYFAVIKTITYTCVSPSTSTRTKRETIFEGSSEGIKKGQHSKKCLRIRLPNSLVSSTLISCPIKVEYFIKIKAVAPGLHSNLKKHIPIMIGAIPICADSKRFIEPTQYYPLPPYLTVNNNTFATCKVPAVASNCPTEDHRDLFITPNAPSISPSLLFSTHSNTVSSLQPEDLTRPSAPIDSPTDAMGFSTNSSSSAAAMIPPPTYEESQISARLAAVGFRDENRKPSPPPYKEFEITK